MQIIDWKGEKIGDRLTMVFRQKVNGTYTNFTGNTFRFQIRNLAGELLSEATIANGKIVLSTTTVTNDTVTIVIPGSETATFERGAVRYELENLTVEKTLIGGKIVYLPQFSYPT